MMNIFGRIIETAQYIANDRPLYVEPPGSKAYYSSRSAERMEYAALGRKIVAAVQPVATPTELLGADLSDYYLLDRYITTHKPALVLELGSGITTAVIAQAMCNAGRGRLVSVDHVQQFSDETLVRLTEQQRSRVDLFVSPVIGDRAGGVDFLRYKDIPDGDYSLVFIDGPPVIYGRKQFPSADALYIVRRARVPLDLIFDKRICTLNYVSQWLPNVCYDPSLRVGAVRVARSGSIFPAARRKHLTLGSAIEALGLDVAVEPSLKPPCPAAVVVPSQRYPMWSALDDHETS